MAACVAASLAMRDPSRQGVRVCAVVFLPQTQFLAERFEKIKDI